MSTVDTTMAMTEAWPAPTTTSAASSPRPMSANTNGSRRPSRKSTLTQQQKNQKRQRATQDQLVTLEVEFNKNPTPTAAVRERIAQDINMTERSVQIWFQNRRAKIKLLAKKSIETGEDCDAIPDSMRQYLAYQAMESGKCLGRGLPMRTTGPTTLAYGPGAEMLLAPEPNNPSKVVIHHLACRALRVGTWRRVGLNAMDLVIFYSPDKAVMTYYINNDSAGYKIEYPFSAIRNITLDPGDGMSSQPGQPSNTGGLVIELTRPPNFFMDSSGSGGFYQCGDFTEEQQASRMLVHHLAGHPKVLSGQLAKLIALDSFRNRHGFMGHHQYPTLAVTASAPVSPGLHRPASQPNHMSHPHMARNLERQFGPHLHPGGRGHKRQRSRSVPAAVDFTALQYPLPALQVPHEVPIPMPSPPLQQHQQQQTMFAAPTPLHQPMGTPVLAAGGSDLRIDTSSGHGMDFRPYPPSAATTVSPSEYASPGLFSVATTTAVSLHEPTPTTMSYHTPLYSLPFLSPHLDASAAMDHGHSPLSCRSPGDPVIANQSPPPMSTMDRCPSTEMFAMPDDPSTMTDDGMSLTELYSKQSLNLPMPSSAAMDAAMDAAAEDLAMQNMISFDTIDPSSLSPEGNTM
ncbi:MAG: hypothetical protein M1823_001853 [Watsoniomyces obsoletus]|nr:MAG: hypothetical protein M1823_001853 [Watsoniomyces obsoletus]